MLGCSQNLTVSSLILVKNFYENFAVQEQY